MKLPYRINPEDFFARYESLQDWADHNSELFSQLILEGGERLAGGEETAITILSIGVPGILGMVVEMDLECAVTTMEVNEEHWVEVEDYERAARARDAAEYIKKRLQHAHSSD